MSVKVAVIVHHDNRCRHGRLLRLPLRLEIDDMAPSRPDLRRTVRAAYKDRLRPQREEGYLPHEDWTRPGRRPDLRPIQCHICLPRSRCRRADQRDAFILPRALHRGTEVCRDTTAGRYARGIMPHAALRAVTPWPLVPRWHRPGNQRCRSHPTDKMATAD